jgi:PAS domain S-box-containing protein
MGAGDWVSIDGYAPALDGVERRDPEHFVQFYEQDDCLGDAVAHFLGQGIDAGGAAVFLGTALHRRLVAERLAARGHALKALTDAGRYVALDAAQTLTAFMVEGKPDAGRFQATVEPLIVRAAADAPRPVHVYGEMVALLWGDGNREGAVALERLWNDLAKRQRFSLLCTYPMRLFGECDGAAFADVCSTHDHVVPTESYTRLETPEERHGLVSQLQQKALALDAEVARRKEIEEVLRRRDRELADLLESSPEGVLDVDPDGRIRWANAAHLETLGYPSEEYVGRNVGEFLVSPAAFVEMWGRLARGQSVSDVEAAFRARDGSSRLVRVRAGTLRMADKALHMRWFLRVPPEPSPD